MTRRPSEIEFGIGCPGELLQHLELVSEIGFGWIWIELDADGWFEIGGR